MATSDNTRLKKQARERQRLTGELYTVALTHVQRQNEKDAVVKDTKMIEELRQVIRNQEDRIRELTNRPVVDPDQVAPKEGAAMALWSTVHLSADEVIASSKVRFFVSALGTAAMKKKSISVSELMRLATEAQQQGLNNLDGLFSPTSVTIADTNLREPGRLPIGVSARVKAMAVELMGGSEKDLIAVKSGVLQLDLAETMISVCPPLGAFTWDASGRVGTARISSGEWSQEEQESRRAVFGGRNLTLPGSGSFAFSLSFGSDTPPLVEDMKIRLTLSLEYASVFEIG